MFADCITFEDISPENLICVYEGKTPYYFDIESLYRHYLFSKRLENPCTRTLLTQEIQTKINNYSRNDKMSIQINFEQELCLNIDTSIGHAILHILLALGNYNRITHINIICQSRSFFDYNLTDTLKQFKKKRLQCVITHSSTVDNLRKFLAFLRQLPPKDNSRLLIEIIDCELRYGTVKPI